MFHGFSQHFCHPSWHQNPPRKTPKWELLKLLGPHPHIREASCCFFSISAGRILLWKSMKTWLFQVGSSSIHREHLWKYVNTHTHIYIYNEDMTIFDDHQNDAYPSNCAVKMTISSNHGQAGFAVKKVHWMILSFNHEIMRHVIQCL